MALGDGPLGSLADVFTIFQAGVLQVSGRFEEGATMILGVCILIVLIKSWLEAVGEQDMVSWVQDIIYMFVLGTILLMGIQKHEQVAALAWGLQGSVMELMNVGGDITNDGTGAGVINYLYQNTMQTVKAVWGLAIASDQDPSICAAEPWPQSVACGVTEKFKVLASDVFSAGIFILLLAMILIYLLIMLLQIFTGWFMVGIGLAFLPVCLAFYPLVESWAKNAIGLIVSGIAHMGVVAFMLSLVTTIINRLTAEFVAGRYKLWVGDGTEPGIVGVSGDMISAVLSKVFILLVLCVVMLVLALSTAKAIGFATQIFGTMSGMVGVKGKSSKPSGGGEGGGKGGGGGDTKAVSGPAGGAVETAASAAGDTAGAAATGGASVAVTAAKSAAQVATKGASMMADQMKDNRR